MRVGPFFLPRVSNGGGCDIGLRRGMGEFWVGIRGDLTAEQIEALKAAGIVVYDLRRTAGAWGEPPFEWETLRTFVSVSAADDSEAKSVVAQPLGLDDTDLIAYSAEIFR
jgi:hypothetical protein